MAFVKHVTVPGNTGKCKEQLRFVTILVYDGRMVQHVDLSPFLGMDTIILSLHFDGILSLPVDPQLSKFLLYPVLPV